MILRQAQDKRRLVLVDGHAILHRAFHALPPLTTRNGQLVNAVYGFATMLFRIMDELHPEYITVAFDTPGPNFRHSEFVGYQAKRPITDQELIGQVERVHELVRAFNIPIFESPGFEADDTIGTLARLASKRKTPARLASQREAGRQNARLQTTCNVGQAKRKTELEVIIVTGDKDLMQLVNESVKLYMPTKGLSEAQMVGEREVKEKLGIPPRLVVDYKGLVGDQSDGYPGVTGIGPKTAVELLKKFGSLEGVYKGIDPTSSRFGGTTLGAGGIGKNTRTKLLEGKEGAFLSQKLAKIVTDVPLELDLEKCRTTDYDKEKLIGFFKELGFRSLIRRVGGEENQEARIKKQAKKGNENQMSLI